MFFFQSQCFQDHALFKRRGANLFLKKEITLYEALTGYKFLVEQLDGRKLVIENKAGEVTNPGDIKVVKSEGMPVHKNPFEKGHLFVEFVVTMPKPQEMSMEGNALKAHLKKVLPTPPPMKVQNDAEYETHVVADVVPEDYQPRHGSRSEAYEEDDESGGRGGHRVQCNQQ